MAQTETFNLKIKAELGDALRQVAKLEKEIRDLKKQAGDVDIKVKADADDAKRTIKDLLKDVDKLDSEEATIELKLAQQDLAGQLQDIRDEVARLDALDPQVEIKMDQGTQIMADLDQISAKLKEIDATKVDAQVDLDTSGAAAGADRLTDSANKSRNAMANMMGNAAQDLGSFGGIAGSAGVALGQLAEGAADAANSGEKMSSVLKGVGQSLGPIAAVALGLQLIQSKMASIAAQKALDAAAIEGFSDAIDEAGEGLGAINLALRETEGLLNISVPSDNIFAAMFGSDETRTDILEQLAAIGLSASDITKVLADNSAATQNYADLNLHLNHSLELVNAALMAANVPLADRQDIIEALSNGQNNYAAAVKAGADLNEFFALSVEDINHNLAEQENFLRQADHNWGVLLNDLADGRIDTQNAADAWNILQNALNLTDEQMQELVDTKLAEFLEEGNAAAVDFAGSLFDGGEATDEFADALKGLEDPLKTMPDLWDELISMFREGGPEALAASEEAITALADATNLEPGQVLAIIAEQAGVLDEAAAKAQEEIDGLTASIIGMNDELGGAEGRAAAFDRAMGRLDFGRLTEATEVTDFVDALDAVVVAADKLAGINASDFDLIPPADDWQAWRDMPDDQQAIIDSLAQFRVQVQSEMSQAFAAGGSDEARQWASNTRTAITDQLRAAGITSTAAINQILEALGLLPSQVETTISIAVDEQKLAFLTDLAGALDLPEDVAIDVQVAINNGDPAEATRLINEYLASIAPPGEAPRQVHFETDVDTGELQIVYDEAAAGVTVPVTFTVAQVISDIGGLFGNDEAAVTGPTVTVTAVPELTVADAAIADFVAEERTVTIEGEADLHAADSEFDQFVAAERTAKIVGDADLDAADSEFDQFIAAERSADIDAVAHTGAADVALGIVERDRIADIFAMPHSHEYVESLLNNIARDRTATIYVRTVGTAVVPSSRASEGPDTLAVETTATELVGPEAMEAPTALAAVPSGGGSGVAVMAAPAPNVTNNYAISVRAGVIGNRFEVERVITRSLRSAARIGGSRN